jgi:hypothetical protein
LVRSAWASLIFWVRRTQKHGGLGAVLAPDPAYPIGPGNYELELRGGARVNGLNVSWPMATLLVGRDQAELQVFGSIAPIRIARGEVTAVGWTGPGRMGPGLKFRTESGRLDRVTVWVGWKSRQKLEELGWS